MSCIVCSGPTSLRCSGCRSVFYCSREHQKKHWASHKLECKQTYVMGNSERLGRHLLAARDLEAGELVLREVALVLGPKAASGCVCLGCHRPLSTLVHPCSGCGWPLCSTQCRSSPYHTAECSLLERVSGRIRPASLPNAPLTAQVAAYSFVTPLRCLLVKNVSSRYWQSLNDLQSHLEERISTPPYAAYRQNVAKFIGEVLGLYGEGFDDTAILRMCGILDTNSFEVKWPLNHDTGSGQVKARGLFPLTSMVAHDCCPNTRHTFEQEGDGGVPWGRVTMAVYTTVPIRKGEILTATYTQSLWPTKRRRAHLQMAKCFSCECKRCSDPSELGTNFGALRCLRAANGDCDGLLLPNKPLQDIPQWKCSCCQEETPSSYIETVNDSIHKEILERASRVNKKSAEKGRKKNGFLMEPDILEEFLVKYSKTLHPLNHHMVQVKHALNQMYGKTPGLTLKELSNDKLKRKEQLCRELLDVANIFEPGLTLFRAELLVDLHATLVELKERNTSKKTSKHFLLEQLDVSSSMMQEALNVLSTEKDHRHLTD